MKIGIDAMGGDHGALVNVKGAIKALEETDVEIVLIGKKEVIEEELLKYTYDKEKIDIIDTRETILTTEDPAMAIKRKKDSSIVVGMERLKENKIDAFVSSGSTGALLSGGVLIVRRIKGVDRPALGSVFPTPKGGFFILDIGANADCKPKYLQQFGVMGNIYSKEILSKENPKVGIINIGTEEEKGNELTKESYELLKSTKSINFIGNVEARDIMETEVDVLICDGFTGNIVLKVSEGVAITFFGLLKKTFISGIKNKIAATLLKKDLKNFKNSLDYTEYGGAPLLGVQKPIIKAHGSSNEIAIKNAIKQAKKFVDNSVIEKIEKNIMTKGD